MPKRVDHEERRRQITGALLRVAAAKGLHATGIREVAAEAGVSVRLVQYYFGTKEELLLAATHELAVRFGERALARARRAAAERAAARGSASPPTAGPRDVIAAILAEGVPRDEESRALTVVYTAYLALSLTDPALAIAPLLKDTTPSRCVALARQRRTLSRAESTHSKRPGSAETWVNSFSRARRTNKAAERKGVTATARLGTAPLSAVISSRLKSNFFRCARCVASIRLVARSAPGTKGGCRCGQKPRQRHQGAGTCQAGRRRVIIVSAMVALALATGGCTASVHSGGHAVIPSRARTAASPPHRVSQSPSVQLVVEASGDLLIHSAIFDRALVLGGGRHYVFAPMFAAIKPYIQGADLALCHVETPMTPARPTGYPTFNTPPALATAIRQTGWRACSTAGTHSLDQGQSGVNDTIRALDRAGVAHTGTFSSAAAQKTPWIMTVKGVRIAFLAYTELTNGIPSPHPWSVNRASAAQILADAHRARLRGAKVVIVNLHWGDENVAQPSSFQLALADKLTRSPDITAVVGQHVHIVQPVRILNGKTVVFGEGNLISNQTSACCPAASQDGMIVLLTITVDSHGARVTLIRYVPIWVRHPDYVVLPAGTAWRTDRADAAALRASYERTVAVVGRGPGIQPIPAHL